MKRLFILLLAFLMICSGCIAESIFPTLKEPEEEHIPLAPSYGSATGAKPDSITDNPAGGIVVRYENVTVDGYNSFGIYLGGRGYYIGGQEELNDLTSYSITNGVITFSMVYNIKEHEMLLFYPDGIALEDKDVPGYITIKAEDKIIIKGLGEFVFSELVLNERIIVCDYYKYYEYYSKVLDKFTSREKKYMNEKSVYTYLPFKFKNTTTETKKYAGYRNDLFTAKLIYTNYGNVYEFPQNGNGRLYSSFISTGEATYHASSSNKLEGAHNEYYEATPIEVLNEATCAVAFSVPSEIRNSTEGSLAIQLDFATGEKYAIAVR